MLTGVWLAFALLLGAATLAVAQTPSPAAERTGTLTVTTRDTTPLGVPTAIVTVTSADGTSRQLTADTTGVTRFEGLAPGRYDISAEAPGFLPAKTQVTIRRGAKVERQLTLAIAHFAEEVDVTPAALDMQMAEAFATELTPEQLEALPDDPDEMLAALIALAGGDATVRVDGFLSEYLEAGTQLRSVRIRQDGASASAGGGGPRIEIRTQPGGDRWRGNVGGRLRDEALNGRNRFVTQQPQGLTRSGSWSVNGPVVKNRTGLAFSFERSQSIDQQPINAAAPDGLFSTLVRQPADRTSVWAKVDHAIGNHQSLRVELRQSSDAARNQGLSEFDLPERAFARTTRDGELRASHNASLASRHVHDARLQVRWRSSAITPASVAVAERVPGAYATGGAQQQGGRRLRELEYEDELMLALGPRHQAMTGFNVIAGHYSGDEWRNAGGTFTFASLDDLAAHRPTTFTQRSGDPTFAYSVFQFGAFVQDDYRLRKNLVLNLGLRHEWQSTINSRLRLLPRVGVHWTPSSRHRTSVAVSYSQTLQPFLGSLYEQTILVDGRRQRELVITSPSYPDPQAGGTREPTPPGVIRASTSLRAPSTHRVSVGIDQPIARGTKVRLTYTRQIGTDLFRSTDANAPIGGIRPDPSLRNITTLESTGGSRGDSLQVALNTGYQPRRLNVNLSYTLGQIFNHTDNPLTLPPDSANLGAEWGASRQDIRHRFQVAFNSDAWAGFKVNGTLRAQSAPPYTITTGLDLNGDGVFSERPGGVGRNSARGFGSRSLDLTLTWGLNIGQRPLPIRPVRAGVADRAVRTAPRVRFEVYAQSTNALNLVNLQNVNGVQTSPLFGLPTAAAQARRTTFGARLSF